MSGNRITTIGCNIIATSVLLVGGLLVGCSSDDASSDDRSSPPSSDGPDGGSSSGQVDPNGGRTADAPACFAACQNTAFTCQTKGGSASPPSEVELQLDATGCTGTLKQGDASPVAVRLDCTALQVCIGGAPGTTPTDCKPATFSAFTYGYSSDGTALTLCTRN